MPRNFSEIKSGGDNSYALPHPEKWGGGGTRPPPIDARAPARAHPPLGRADHNVINLIPAYRQLLKRAMPTKARSRFDHGLSVRNYGCINSF